MESPARYLLSEDLTLKKFLKKCNENKISPNSVLSCVGSMINPSEASDFMKSTQRVVAILNHGIDVEIDGELFQKGCSNIAVINAFRGMLEKVGL